MLRGIVRFFLPPSTFIVMAMPQIEFARPQKLDSMLLGIEQIYVGDRLRKDYQDLPALIKSLAEFGQIQAIVVRPAQPEDGCTEPWVLVAGGRRFAAALKLGWTHIRAENAEHLSPWKRTAIELEENLQRANMTWQEEVDAKQKIAQLYKNENPGWSDTQTASLLHIDKGQLSRDLKLAKAMEEHPELSKASSKKAAMKLFETKKSLQASAAKASTVDFNTIENSVACSDAADFLDRFEDSSVDLFLSDLPFGIDYFDRPASDREAGGGVSKFDDSLPGALSLVNRIFAKMARKVKPEGWICLMVGEDLRQSIASQVTIVNTQKQAPGKKLSMPQQPWIWYRKNSRNNPIHGHLHAKSMYDIVLPINAGNAVLRKSCENVICIDADYGERFHAHQKPIELGEELISRFTLPGDLVVDITMGSGAFVAAAAKSLRKFAGCDLNPDVVPLAQGLVARYYANTKVGTTPKETNHMGTPLDPTDDFFASAEPDELDEDARHLLDDSADDLDDDFDDDLDDYEDEDDEDPNDEVDSFDDEDEEDDL